MVSPFPFLVIVIAWFLAETLDFLAGSVNFSE